MKTAILILSLFCFNAWSTLEPSILKEDYSDYNDYEGMSFGLTKAYFRKLFNNSVLVSGKDGIQSILVKNSAGNTTLEIKVAIDRYFWETILKENVTYTFPNGNSFKYLITKEGLNLRPTNDKDLLMFKFDSIGKVTRFNLSVPAFSLIQENKIGENFENSFFNLGVMEIKIAINTQITSRDVSRDYLFFYEAMPIPLQQLSVKVSESSEDWRGVEFFHYSRGTSLTPKEFFDGLNSASRVFIGAANIYLSILYEIGFPKFD
jgi:hypothetical protein